MLRQCDRILGVDNVRDHDLTFETVTNAAIFPWRPGLAFWIDDTWGVYDQTGRLVDAAAAKSGGQLQGQSWTCTQPLSGLHRLPDRQYIYCGLILLEYGHFLIETLSRLWAVHDLSEKILIFHGGHELEPIFFDKPYVREIFDLFGISLDNAFIVQEPIEVPLLICPEPAFEAESFGYSKFREICHAVGQGLWDEDQQPRAPVYLTKSQLVGGITRFNNEALIDDVMRQNGVEVISPEQLTFKENVKLLSQNRAFLGSVGSAFHTTIFTKPAPQLLLLNGGTLVNSNYEIIDKLNGNRASYYFSEEATCVPEAEGFSMSYSLPNPTADALELLSHLSA